MTKDKAKRILNEEFRYVDGSVIKDDGLNFIQLTREGGGTLDSYFEADTLRAIVYWLDHPEEFSERIEHKDR